jgi:hypothetical protein
MRAAVRIAMKWLLPMLALSQVTVAADEGRLSFLEQEVRNLQRQVQVLTRQLDELRTRPDRLTPPTSAPDAASERSETTLPRWVDAQRWRQLRPGMTELDVINSLGPPNTIRDEDGARVLFYAMELGSSRFLGGSVKLRQRAVVEVLSPTLQ